MKKILCFLFSIALLQSCDLLESELETTSTQSDSDIISVCGPISNHYIEWTNEGVQVMSVDFSSGVTTVVDFLDNVRNVTYQHYAKYDHNVNALYFVGINSDGYLTLYSYKISTREFEVITVLGEMMNYFIAGVDFEGAVLAVGWTGNAHGLVRIHPQDKTESLVTILPEMAAMKQGQALMSCTGRYVYSLGVSQENEDLIYRYDLAADTHETYPDYDGTFDSIHAVLDGGYLLGISIQGDTLTPVKKRLSTGENEFFGSLDGLSHLDFVSASYDYSQGKIYFNDQYALYGYGLEQNIAEQVILDSVFYLAR